MTKALQRWSVSLGLLGALILWWGVGDLAAHGVAQNDAAFFLTNVGRAILVSVFNRDSRSLMPRNSPNR